jgi:hypothetical protein
MADEFTERATALAVKEAETELIDATRAFEDAQRAGSDDYSTLSGAEALRRYNRAILEYNNLTGANQPQQQANGQRSEAMKNSIDDFFCALSFLLRPGDPDHNRRMIADFAQISGIPEQEISERLARSLTPDGAKQ